ncbi:hypothetical protein MNBD_ALPHA02-2315 [hydrothermal vent metagenome]|uniref:AB hydrolase-1 domain-containing protein n=1 Tax=hydrothermal vent metagenome TaxID=652676 RepID=A0A3B0R911_9ZZZZ
MKKPDEKRYPVRHGPHPLALHVASATHNWTAAAAALPLFHLGGLQIHPDLKEQFDSLRRRMAGCDLEQLQLLILKKAQTRLSETLAGLRAYQDHTYVRNVPAAPVFHKIGTTEMLNYGTGSPKDAPVVIAVPSLVNPAYILDLREDHSLMRFLEHQNIHPYLLDWTAPGAEEMSFGLEDYILKRLIPLIRAVYQQHGRKIHLLGYCMGGNLSLAAARILQDESILESLTLIATPWDFHTDQPAHLVALTTQFLKMDRLSLPEKAVAMNIMQLFFFSLDPTLSDRKFRKFDALDPASAESRDFVAIEDWANDGSPLAPGVARDCLCHWYRDNQPDKNRWSIGGNLINPAHLTLPGHIITPTSDRIVPAASAKALQEKLPRFHHTTVPGGHVSMIAGKDAKTILWPKLASYLK